MGREVSRVSWLDWVWLILTFVCVVLEIVTYGIFFVLFAVGTLAAFIVAMFTQSIAIQVVIFAVVTVLCLLFLRPVVRKWLGLGKYGKGRSVPDYIEQYQGKEGIVTKAIVKDDKGEVKIGTEVWTACAKDGESIQTGAKVSIVRIEGVTAIVESKTATTSSFGLKN